LYLIHPAEQINQVLVVSDDDQLEVVLRRVLRYQVAQGGRQRLDVLAVQVRGGFVKTVKQ
jgi:hypothetical protein